jgi:hypothetical protein
LEDFFRRRQKSKLMLYVMIGFLVLGLALVILGGIFVLSL